jgi:hypothetical protein
VTLMPIRDLELEPVTGPGGPVDKWEEDEDLEPTIDPIELDDPEELEDDDLFEDDEFADGDAEDY